MKIKWSTQAELSYLENLNYWDNRNKSHTYSDKIDEELSKLEQEISVSPYFLAQYIEEENVYQRIFFKKRFILYYEVKDDIVIILRFRSTKQNPLF